MNNFTGRVYEPVRATTTMRNAPRFGHGNDFSALFSDSQEDQSDYLWGLTFAGCFILAMFIAWTILLLILKCLGKDRVGFLSGSAFTADAPRPFYIRISFVTACINFIIFTILCVTQGVTNLHSAVSEVGNSNDYVQSMLRNAEDIASSLMYIGQSSAAIRDELASNLGNFCPAQPDLAQVTGVDFDALATQAIDLLNELGDFIENDVAGMSDSISLALTTSEVVEDTVNTIEANDWQSLLILIPYLTLACLMLVAVTLAWFNTSNLVFTRVMTYCILPLFFIATLAAAFCSSFSAFSAVANADACSGGADLTPDGTVYSVLERTGVDQASFYYRGIQYYVSQCAFEDPFGIIRDYQAQIESASKTVNDLSSSLETVTIESLNLYCGKDFGPLDGILQTMSENLSTLSDNADMTLTLLSCEKVVPIYVNTVYGAACTYSVTGVTWTWASFLVMAFMGMLMVTFRAAYLPNEDNFETNSRSDYSFEKDSVDNAMTRPSSAESSPYKIDESRDDESIYFDDYSVSMGETEEKTRGSRKIDESHDDESMYSDDHSVSIGETEEKPRGSR